MLVVSRKDDAAELLLDGQPVPLVAAATGLKASTVQHIRNRLDSPIPGDPNYRGAGIIKCRLCGSPCAQHPLRPCAASAD